MDRRLCSACKVCKAREDFSRKQFKAPEHERRCLVCSGLSDETGVPGLHLRDAVRLHGLRAAEFNDLVGEVATALNGGRAVCGVLCDRSRNEQSA
jgi:hypothetical protein